MKWSFFLGVRAQGSLRSPCVLFLCWVPWLISLKSFVRFMAVPSLLLHFWEAGATSSGQIPTVQERDDFTPSPLWSWKIFADGWMPLRRMPRRMSVGWDWGRGKGWSLCIFLPQSGKPMATQMFPAHPIIITQIKMMENIYWVLLTCLAWCLAHTWVQQLWMEWMNSIFLKHFLHQVSFYSQKILRERFYYDPHFVEKQTEAQRDAELCVRPSQKHRKEQDLFFFRFSLCIPPACLWGPFPPHVRHLRSSLLLSCPSRLSPLMSGAGLQEWHIAPSSSLCAC